MIDLVSGLFLLLVIALLVSHFVLHLSFADLKKKVAEMMSVHDDTADAALTAADAAHQAASAANTAAAIASSATSTTTSYAAAPPSPVIAPATVPPAASPAFVVVDATNGLVRFPTAKPDPYWKDYVFTYEGAKPLFSPDSQAWHTIDKNGGEVEFALQNPGLGWLSQRGVHIMVQKTAPGTTNVYWTFDETLKAIPLTLAIPKHIVADADAIVWIEALKPQNTGGGGTFVPGQPTS